MRLPELGGPKPLPPSPRTPHILSSGKLPLETAGPLSSSVFAVLQDVEADPFGHSVLSMVDLHIFGGALDEHDRVVLASPQLSLATADVTPPPGLADDCCCEMAPVLEPAAEER